MSTVTTNENHATKHGYYPCSKEDYLKLKYAHGLLLRAYIDVKRWHRWSNKQEHNRSGPEPKAPLHLDYYGWQKMGITKDGTRRSYYGEGFKVTSSAQPRAHGVNYYLHILEQYQNARRPKATSEEVLFLDLPKDLDDTIKSIEKFYDQG